MTEEDWQLLDWDNLRNRAKNRIAEKAESLAGFAMVRILNKAKAKSAYLLPLTEQEREFFEQTGEVPFGNEADDLELSPRAVKLEDFRNNLLDLMLVYTVPVVLAAMIDVSETVVENEAVRSGFVEEVEEILEGAAEWVSLAADLTGTSWLGYDQMEELVTSVEDRFFEEEDDALTELDDNLGV